MSSVKGWSVCCSRRLDQFTRCCYSFGDFSVEELESRRGKLAKFLPRNSVSFIFSGGHVDLTRGIPRPYRCESNFYYATGLTEVNSSVCIRKDDNYNVEYTLFLSDEIDVWFGPGIDHEEAKILSGIENIHVSSSFNSLLPELVEDIPFVFSNKPEILRRMHDFEDQIEINTDLDSLFKLLRSSKTREEVEIIQNAVDITEIMFREIMSTVKPPINENEIYGLIEYHSRVNGAQRLSFTPIVAGGCRSGIIGYEYSLNNQMIYENEHVVVDCGCEYNMYSSDITRAFPINGKFTPVQKNLYEAVLATNKLLMEEIKPGMNVYDIDTITETSLTNELLEREICKNISFDDLFKDINEVFTGVWGHPMGMGIHENWKSFDLPEDTVMTIEPSIRFDLSHRDILERMNVEEAYMGMGMSIEDDVFLSEDGVINLSGNIPKECDEIEELMNS